ncbi:MAG TPA: hypothetical protein VEA80_20325 [Vitreimonas sp.]|uniref:hypothetical protein n=1 Tax=Vitreimonas sp. TaxID=3069702 RepID=UPI002D3B854B|nr:hypothetical protein [Vitreimonas sp.]HYD89838.1 hypothetical protein [Vitreimonas sp.]
MQGGSEKPACTWRYYFARVGATLSVGAGLTAIKILVSRAHGDLRETGQDVAAVLVAGSQGIAWMFGIWTIFKIWDREIGRSPQSITAPPSDSPQER